MKAFTLLLGFIVYVLGDTTSNPSYQCNGSAKAQWKTDEGCIKLDPENQNMIDIRPCTDINKFCPQNSDPGQDEIQCKVGGQFTPTAPTYGGYPGDPCRSNADCKTLASSCGMGYCAGVPKGSKCNNDQDCNPGNFCDNTQSTPMCAPQVAAGEPCARDNQCVLNTGCNQNTCTLFYSLEATKVVDDCSSTTSKYLNFPVGSSSGILYSVFCESGTCENAGTCSTPMTTNAPIPVSCNVATQDKDCATSNGVDGDLKSNTECIAGKNTNGDYYCQVDIGDTPYTDLINWITTVWMKMVADPNMQPYCNTAHRGIDIQCLLRMGGQYLVNQFNMAWFSTANYPFYVDSDLCTMQVFNNEYFGPQQYNLFCDTHFTCTNSTFTNNLSCIQESQSNGNAFTIRSCTDTLNPSCPPATFYSSLGNEVQCIPSAPAAAPGTNLLPGDICSSNSQCLSTNCPYGTCVGSTSTCDLDTDCNPGLYCNKAGTENKCTALIAAGSSTTCTNDQQCAMNAGCNIGENGGNGVCTTYYSVEVGKTVSDCGAEGVFIKGSSYYVYYSNMCASGTCELISGTNAANYGTCVSAYSTGTFPATCNFLPNDCPSSSNSQTGSPGLSNTQCSCSQTDGTRYCSLDLADAPFQDLISWSNVYFTNFTTYYSSMCHTTRRGFDPLCMQKVGGTPRMMQFTEKYSLAVNYASICNAENCTLSVYQPQYWAAYQYNHPLKPDTLNSAMGVLGLAVAFFALAN